MPANRSSDLHGFVPDNSKAALILIDVINRMDFPGSEKLIPSAERMAKNLLRLKERTRKVGIPSIYVNDNFGRWRSDFRAIVNSCLEDDVPGRKVVELLKPSEEDYFVLKPKHSGFYSTSLDLLLVHLGSKNLIVTGIATNICVLFTANDAYMRDYNVIIPSDCVAEEDKEESKNVLKLMKKVLKADIKNSKRIDLKKLLR
jgi:nicotinamidase-related amidase